MKQTIAAGRTLPVGTPWGFPFTITVPPDAHPTAFTPRGTVRWLLRGVVDRMAGRIFPLDQALVILGRRETNTIVVPEQAVSRMHAEIRLVDSAYVLRDLGSTSGTYLNGTPLAGEHHLCAGNVVGLGPGVTFTVRVAAVGE